MREFSVGAGDEWVDSGGHHTQDRPEKAECTRHRRLHAVARPCYFTVLTGAHLRGLPRLEAGGSRLRCPEAA